VTIRYHPFDGELEFVVNDTGIGISEED